MRLTWLGARLLAAHDFGRSSSIPQILPLRLTKRHPRPSDNAQRPSPPLHTVDPAPTSASCHSCAVNPSMGMWAWFLFDSTLRLETQKDTTLFSSLGGRRSPNFDTLTHTHNFLASKDPISTQFRWAPAGAKQHPTFQKESLPRRMQHMASCARKRLGNSSDCP